MQAAIAIPAERSGVWQRLLRFPVAVCGLLVCVTFCFCCLRFSDPDTWLHLKLGQEIWRTRAIPRLDHWSFTVNGKPRIDHEWLSQLSIYIAYLAWGYRGLQLWLCALASAIMAEAYVLCYRYCGNAKIAALGGFLAFFFGTIGFSIRPHLIGYALLALELLLLERAWRGRPRLLWWLPLLFMVWVNCHGSWVVGLGIFGIATLCSYVAGRRSGWVRGPRPGLLAGVLAAVFIVALVFNPIGIKLLTYPVNVFASQRTSLGFLDEWLPLTVNDVRGVGLFAVLAAMGIAGLKNKARATVFELLVLVPVSFLAVQHTRMMFVFGIVSGPIACRMLSEWWRPDRTRDYAPINVLLLSTTALCCCAAFPGQARIQADIESHNPVKAVEFIRRSGLQGNLMHDYMWGGYLAWALPERKIFIDGRADIYDWAGVLARYRDWALVQSDPARLLDDYRIGLCLLPLTAPEAYVMPHLHGWKKVYGDEVAVVFARE